MPLQSDTNIEELEKYLREELAEAKERINTDTGRDTSYLDEFLTAQIRMLEEIIENFF